MLMWTRERLLEFFKERAAVKRDLVGPNFAARGFARKELRKYDSILRREIAAGARHRRKPEPLDRA